MVNSFKLQVRASAISASLALCTPQFVAASPIEVLTNGDFEAGIAGWTATDQAGGNGSWFVDTPGTTTPVSTHATLDVGGGAHGNSYAVTDQAAPGAHALTQSFAVAPNMRVTLSFDMFANNWGAPSNCFLDHLNYDLRASNQCVHVDLLTGAATPFDTGVLVNFYLGADGGANPNPFTHYMFDITPFVDTGGTFQVRFLEVDNRGFFNAGVDNVSITVPEPATLALLGIGLTGLAYSRRRKLN